MPRKVLVDETVIRLTVGGGTKDTKGGEPRDYRIGKPCSKWRGEERVSFSERGRVSLETTVRKLAPMGDGGSVDLHIFRYFSFVSRKGRKLPTFASSPSSSVEVMKLWM